MAEASSLYEIVALFSPALNEEELNQSKVAITEAIAAHRGIVESEDIAHKRRLGYPIGTAREAHVITLRATVESARAPELASALQKHPGTLRIGLYRWRRIEDRAKRFAGAHPTAPTETHAISEEAIDKQLDEILH